MKKASLFAVPAILFLVGCNLDSSHDQSTAPADSDDTKAAGWEALPEGRTYLPAGADSEGTPLFTPVRLLDTMALIEGDIIVASGKEQMEKLRAELVDPKESRPAALAKSSGFVKTSTYLGGANAWPGGYIPYLIGGGVDKNAIEKAVYEFNQTGSGITYVNRKPTDAQGVVFVASSEQVSSSAVGLTTPGQWQGIFILAGSTPGVIMHEMGHAAGLYHEHARPDRDSYINIATSGVDGLGMWARGYATQNDGTTVGNYDLNSIMHYANGTVTFTNPNGTLYRVTLTAKNGQATGNSHISAGDQVSLWGIPVNQNPFIGVSTISNVTGKITKVYVTNYNGVNKRWILTYDRNTGNANVTALNDDNSVANSVQNLFIGSNFTTVLPYSSGTGAPCMLFYKATTGEVKLYTVIAAGGALNPTPLYSGGAGSWNTGWTNIEFYEVINKRYWFFQNATNSVVNIWNINDAGTLGPLTYNATWPGWVYSKPFYIETSPAVPSTYFVFRDNTGFTRIRQMTAEGGVGYVVQDIQLPNYPTVGLWQSVSKAYLGMTSGNTLLIADMDNTGFRKTGLAWYRVSTLGRQVGEIDAATILYSTNNSGTFINNKLYDFKQVLTVKWANLPNYVYTGFMAPFH
jgi:hypothetical protein